jgi:hypothetical protein
MANTYTLLETITVGAAGASSVTFNSIPQTGYTDLVIKTSVRGTVAEDGFSFRFNSDSGSNYPYRRLIGNGASVSSDSGTTTAIPQGRQSESGYTANTFGNCEFYIPNYTSANYKSVSADSVNENNATTARAQLGASLWNSTAAITSINIFPGAGAFAQYSTFSLYGVSALGVTPTKAPKATGGSIIQTDGTYWYHAFLSSGTFTPATALSCDVLVVAGGGSGGWPYAGGGGAGGVVYLTSQSVGTSAQTVTVGGGATGAYNTGNGAKGSNSQFASLTAAVGGGGGLGDSGTNNSAGGSGGGGAAYSFSSSNNAGGSATSGQGFAGGAGSPNGAAIATGGGGGGAGAIGGTGTGSIGGAGGAGTNAYSSWLSTVGLGVSGYIAGGGGGGSAIGANPGAGGSGGGGVGADNDGTEAGAGVANTGGGSGGGAAGNAPASPKNGGSGLVIVRYLA